VFNYTTGLSVKKIVEKAILSYRKTKILKKGITNMNAYESKQINVGTRIGAMILDHFFMTIIAMLFFIPGMISGFSNAFKVSHEQTNPNFMGGAFGYIGMIGFALYFCKDIINGRSFAKKILKLQVVDNSTGQPANPLKCLIRNLLCIIWPIEVIVAITNTDRRLGDRIAGTKLVNFDPTLEQPRINIVKTLIPIGIAYGAILLLMQVIPKMEVAKTTYNENSFNETESKELEKLLTDSLGRYLTADIKIYDTVRNSNLKYVSTILNLKENYLEDNNTYKQLEVATENLIYSKFPKETITGQIKYVFQGPGQFQSTSEHIGTIIKRQNEK
jgi:uncharacterized RDD family membrane protein YckC